MGNELKLVAFVVKEEDYSILTFRHTWATIAFNELGLDWQAVAFAMNHGSAHRVT